MTMYSELFKLFDFGQDEIERERPRIDKAFKKLEIGPDDVKKAEKRVVENFDTEFVGTRKLLGAYMKEFINLVLTEEEGKKWVYTPSPPYPLVIDTLRMASRDKGVYVSPISWFFANCLGGIFDKIIPVLEAGEAAGLKPGLAHCSFNQIDIGSVETGIMPKPAMAVDYRYFCDQGPEATELMHYLYDCPTAYIDYCPDLDRRKLSEVPHRNIKYFAGELKAAFDEFGKVMGHEVTDEHKQETLAQNAAYWMTLQGLLNILRTSDPQPIGLPDLALLLFSTFCIPDKDKVNEIVVMFTEEAKERAAKGKGVVEKGAPRVYLFLPSMADPTVNNMIQNLGLAVPALLHAPFVAQEMTPVEATTPEEQMAEFTLKRMIFKGTAEMIDYVKTICESWELDGAIIAYHFSCRPLATMPMMMKEKITKELGIPVLPLEMDVVDPRDYSAGQLKTRVETFAELLKARKPVAVRKAS